MKRKDKNAVGVVDRVITCVVSATLIFITCVVITMIFIKGAPLVSTDVIANAWYWKLALILSGLAGIMGFFLGGSRMAEVLGSLWRTNKPKDGNWL